MENQEYGMDDIALTEYQGLRLFRRSEVLTVTAATTWNRPGRFDSTEAAAYV